MGHERVGYLPKSQRWKGIVKKISEFSSESGGIEDIATETTKNVRGKFKNITEDAGVVSAFKFLILIAHAAKKENPTEFLKSKGISLSQGFNIFDLTGSVQEFVTKHQNSKEYSTFAIQSMIDTIGEWSSKNQVQQASIFDTGKNSFQAWEKAAEGSGFCELSRIFFSSFTSRYLKYFLEREAATKLQSLSDRAQFSRKLESHVQDISQHAFETAKIAQSFAAGWYNLNAKDTIPTEEKLRNFLGFAFKKLNSELLREENSE